MLTSRKGFFPLWMVLITSIGLGQPLSTGSFDFFTSTPLGQEMKGISQELQRLTLEMENVISRDIPSEVQTSSEAARLWIEQTKSVLGKWKEACDEHGPLCRQLDSIRSEIDRAIEIAGQMALPNIELRVNRLKALRQANVGTQAELRSLRNEIDVSSRSLDDQLKLIQLDASIGVFECAQNDLTSIFSGMRSVLKRLRDIHNSRGVCQPSEMPPTTEAAIIPAD